MKPYHVLVCANRFDTKDTWAVRYGFRWLVGRIVSIHVPMTTRFRGNASRQPKAYLEGYGVARQVGSRISVTAS